MTKAIQIQLQPIVEKTQMAYLGDGRQMKDSTILMSELADLLERRGGGVALQIDNKAAFDVVRWDFIHDILEAYGLPEDIRELMKTIYSELSIKVKVNGQIGREVPVTNGVRQGCGISPLIFILVQEALLISIRRDTGPDALKGIEIIRGVEVRERGMADDTVVYIQDMKQVKRLFKIIETHERASGQSLNASKTCAILVGTEKQVEAVSPLL